VSIDKHRLESKDINVRFCVIVTSDKVLQGVYEDRVVPLVSEVLSRHGFSLSNHSVVPNDRERIGLIVSNSLASCDVVLLTGGTGLGPRDLSVDVVRDMCTKDIPGFGELFRYLTYQVHGTAALATRAMACAVGDRLVFVTPGSTDAVGLALEKLILPEVRHLIAELRGLRH
jgi:molybdenum cofactor biosynthesis protein B